MPSLLCIHCIWSLIIIIVITLILWAVSSIRILKLSAHCLPGPLRMRVFWYLLLFFCWLLLFHLELIVFYIFFWISFVGIPFCAICCCTEGDNNELEVFCFGLNSCTNWLAFVNRQLRSLISNNWDSISVGKYSLNVSIIWALVAPMSVANRSNSCANYCTVCWSELKFSLFQTQLRYLSVSPDLLISLERWFLNC